MKKCNICQVAINERDGYTTLRSIMSITHSHRDKDNRLINKPVRRKEKVSVWCIGCVKKLGKK